VTPCLRTHWREARHHDSRIQNIYIPRYCGSLPPSHQGCLTHSSHTKRGYTGHLTDIATMAAREDATVEGMAANTDLALPPRARWIRLLHGNMPPSTQHCPRDKRNRNMAASIDTLLACALSCMHCPSRQSPTCSYATSTSLRPLPFKRRCSVAHACGVAVSMWSLLLWLPSSSCATGQWPSLSCHPCVTSAVPCMSVQPMCSRLIDCRLPAAVSVADVTQLRCYMQPPPP
jgi:hypothetical protein